MFPEGTRHSAQETGMLPFKKGAFHLAIQAGVPIIPVVCQNYWHLYHNGVLDSGKLKIVGKCRNRAVAGSHATTSTPSQGERLLIPHLRAHD